MESTQRRITEQWAVPEVNPAFEVITQAQEDCCGTQPEVIHG
jgi:hypothetical protein